MKVPAVIFGLLLGAYSLLSYGANPMIIDVRTQGEWDSGHLQSAVHLPLDSLSRDIETVAPNKRQRIFLYCRSGNRSGQAAKIMLNLGYSDVVNAGGIGDASEALNLEIIQ
jgi:phage shock protein E